MARTIRERMNVRDNEVFTPVDLINAKTLSSVINSFFGTSQLSQFMDQINPLAEIRPQTPSVGPRSRRSVARPCRFRGARRTLHALRPPLPDRIAGRPQHRSDLVAVRLCEDFTDGIHRDALPHGGERPDRPGQLAHPLLLGRGGRGQDRGAVEHADRRRGQFPATRAYQGASGCRFPRGYGQTR